MLADGSTEPIDQVKVDDVVLATDPATGKTEPHRVVGRDVHGDEPQRTELTVLSDGKSGTIEATDWHLFWVEEAAGWVEVGDVQVGEHLHSPDGHTVVVTEVRHFVQTSPVYDLTVDSVHDFYIATRANSLLVHNCAAARSNGPVLTKAQSNDVARSLGYGPTKFLSAGRGKPKIWINRNAPAAERYLTQDTTGHAGGLFKAGSSVASLQSTGNVLRSGTYDLDYLSGVGQFLTRIGS